MSPNQYELNYSQTDQWIQNALLQSNNDIIATTTPWSCDSTCSSPEHIDDVCAIEFTEMGLQCHSPMLFDGAVDEAVGTEASLPQNETSSSYQCAECTYRSSTSADLQKHGQTENHKPFVCSVSNCHKSFARHDSFIRHCNAHKDVVYVCKQCSLKFKRKDNLEAHHKRIHGKPARRRAESRSRQASTAPSPVSEYQQTLFGGNACWEPEKSGLKCVAGALRHIVDDGGCLAHVDRMIDELNSAETQDLAKRLAWTMMSHSPRGMLPVSMAR